MSWASAALRSCAVAADAVGGAPHEEWEDEMAVEHMLAGPSSPAMSGPMHTAAATTTPAHAFFATPQAPAPNAFATADPFYTASLAQAQGAAPSFFAQAARPAAASPFAAHATGPFGGPLHATAQAHAPLFATPAFAGAAWTSA
jgi:hypothetical protein